MADTQKTVFISYRRTNSFHALAVYQNLTAHGYDCFFDYNSIDSGGFESIILNNIASRAHFIVILTPSALERCAEPGDWLRREIEYAIEQKRNIVPLMLEGFDYGSSAIAKYLTGKLAALKDYNALRVPADFFDEAMARLRTRFLSQSLDGIIHPASATAQQAAVKQKAAVRSEPEVTEESLTASEWFERGYQAQEGERVDLNEAIRCYSEAIRRKPDYPEAYNNRGDAYLNLKRYDEALRDLNEAIRLKPDDALAYVGRGLAYLNLKRYDEALRDLNEAIRLKPDDALAYVCRGLVYDKLGDRDREIADYEQALRIDPNHKLAKKSLAIARREKREGK